MAEKCKLDDVAKKAGVSLSTASLVLSDQGRISPETRARVLGVALELGHRQKKRKSDDRKSSDSRAIALLFDIDPTWSVVLTLIRPVIQEFEHTLRQAGFNTILIPISRSEPDGDIAEKVRCSGVVGVASIHFASPDLVLLLEAAGIPVVIVMNSSFQDRFYTVCVDDFQGSYEGTSYLIKAGHLRLGFIDCDRSGLPVLPVDRFFGFTKAIEEYHLDYDEGLRVRVPLDDDLAAADSVTTLVRGHPDMSAIFALDDELAVRVVTILARIGIRVPEDISILAPGDLLDYSLCYLPPITTMRIDTTYMGRIAAQMMLNRITRNPQELHVLKVKQLLVKRGSVREAAPV
ncbi:MAG: LacI family DNA-binding transcriptional regulator [Spirochaetota bacterium]